MDDLLHPHLTAIRLQCEKGKSWEQIADYLSFRGVAIEGNHLRRWANANGIAKRLDGSKGKPNMKKGW